MVMILIKKGKEDLTNVKYDLEGFKDKESKDIWLDSIIELLEIIKKDGRLGKHFKIE